jgi:hypothetical protein
MVYRVPRSSIVSWQVSAGTGAGDLSLVSKQLLQTWFFFRAFRTADMGPGHINQVLTAKGGYFETPVEPKKPLFYSGLQDQIGAAVRPENSGNRTIRTIFGLPLCRTGIAVNQAACLFIAPTVIILIVKSTFLSGWSNHIFFPGA